MTDSVMFSATYFDGQSSAAHAVQVRCQGLALHVSSPDHLFDAFVWYADDLVIYSGKGATRIKLGLKKDTGARLSFEDGAFTDWLKEAHVISAEAHDRPGNLKIAGWVLAGVVGILAFIFYGLQALAGLIVAFVPESWDRSVWAQVEPGIERHWSACQQAEGVEAMDRIKAELVPLTRFTMEDISVRVVDLPIVNAFAFPGGGIVFTSKLIEEAESPAEIAGVMAHELGHVEYRHGTRAMIESMGLGTALSLILGDTTGAILLATVSEQLLQATYTREKEGQSDRFAMTLLTDSGIGTQGMTRFFERLTRREGNIPEILSTHPVTKDRIEFFANGPLAERSLLDDRQWDALKSICDQPSAEPEGESL